MTSSSAAAPARPPMPLVWLRELRAPFFTGTIAPVAFGAAYAYYRGAAFNPGLFAITLAGALLTHAGLNMANDVWDHYSGDDNYTTATPVSGGSKVIQEGLLSPRQILRASVGCLVLAAAIGVWLALRLPPGARLALLAVGLVGMLFAWFYVAPPLRLAHRGGMGELACTIGFGPAMVFGTYLVQSRAFSLPALLAGLPIGILMGLVLFINEFQDVAADAQVGKRTLVVVAGTRGASYVLVAALAAAYLVTGAFVLLRVFPPAALLTFATLPLAWFAGARALRSHDDRTRLLPASFAIIGLHLAFSTVLTVATVL